MDINWIIRNLRILRNPFQNTPGNIKFPNFVESNRVTLLHTVKAWNISRFDNSIGCFSDKLEKGFETVLFLLCGLKSKSNFAKNTFLICKNNFKVWLAFWKLIYYKIVNLLLKGFTIFTKVTVTFARRVFVNHFQIFKIIFRIVQLFFQCLDSFFQPIIHAFQAVVQKGQPISFFMSLFKSIKKLAVIFKVY